MSGSRDKRSISKLERILLAVLIVILAFLLAIFINHKIMTHQEMKLLKANGYYNPVSVGDHSLNVAKFGKEDGKHTIVALAGLGMGDYSVLERRMTEILEEDNLVVYVDRAGYGLSGDSDKKMTIENIVEDYRTALKNSGIDGPYILMPHSLGGAYTSYWASKYPEEIEAVVFLDGTQLSENLSFGPGGDGEIRFMDKAQTLILKLGFGRFIKEYHYKYSDMFTEDEQKMGDALRYMTMDSYSTGSESDLITSNVRAAWNSIETNDVPKLYICASWGFKTEEELTSYNKWANDQIRKRNLGKPFRYEKFEDKGYVKNLLEQYEEARQTQLYPYCEKMGNCKVVLMPGDHNIFEQYPSELGHLIKDFIDGL